MLYGCEPAKDLGASLVCEQVRSNLGATAVPVAVTMSVKGAEGALVKWFREYGGRMDKVCLRDLGGDMQLSLVTTGHIARGDVVISVPTSLCMTIDSVRYRALRKSGLTVQDVDSYSSSLLAQGDQRKSAVRLHGV